MIFSSPPRITFSEVPNEISLTYLISGCTLNCKGCHSVEAKNFDYGTPLTPDILTEQLTHHVSFITAVCFLGGDHSEAELCELLDVVKAFNLKTCLYTGKRAVSDPIASRLDFLKVGPYVQKYGGLRSTTTNQKFYSLPSFTNITHFFHKGEYH